MENKPTNEEIATVLIDITLTFITKHTIPLLQSLGNGRVKSLGSGVFTKIRDSFFILTASHVVEGMENNYIYVPSTSGIIPVNEHSITLNHNDKDIAFIAIGAPIATLLTYTFDYLPQNQISLVFDPSPRLPYMMIGYPARYVKQKQRFLSYDHDIFLLHNFAKKKLTIGIILISLFILLWICGGVLI